MRPKLSVLAICTIFWMFGGKLKIEIWITVCYKYIGLYFQTKAYLILYPALKRVTTTTYYYIIQYKQMYVSDTLFYVLLHWDTMIIIIVHTKHFQECFSLWQKQNFRENVQLTNFWWKPSLSHKWWGFDYFANLFFPFFNMCTKHNSFWIENQTFAIHHFLEGKAIHFAFNLRYEQ